MLPLESVTHVDTDTRASAVFQLHQPRFSQRLA